MSIISNNQSGGITAHTINLNGIKSNTPKQKKNLWKIIFSIASFIAALCGIFTYFDFGIRKKAIPITSTNYNINRSNQAGGITTIQKNFDRKEQINPIEKKEEAMNHNTYNVSSTGQTGGITAGQVNINKPVLQLTEPLKMALLQELNKEDKNTLKIILYSVLGDSEGFNLAYEIKEYIETLGYNINGVNQGVFTTPQKGIQFEQRDNNNTRKLVVSSNI